MKTELESYDAHRRLIGTAGVLGALAYFATWDAVAYRLNGPTISERYNVGVEENAPLWIGALVVGGAHVTGKVFGKYLPQWMDPIDQFGKRVLRMTSLVAKDS